MQKSGRVRIQPLPFAPTGTARPRYHHAPTLLLIVRSGGGSVVHFELSALP